MVQILTLLAAQALLLAIVFRWVARRIAARRHLALMNRMDWTRQSPRGRLTRN